MLGQKNKLRVHLRTGKSSSMTLSQSLKTCGGTHWMHLGARMARNQVINSRVEGRNFTKNTHQHHQHTIPLFHYILPSPLHFPAARNPDSRPFRRQSHKPTFEALRRDRIGYRECSLAGSFTLAEKIDSECEEYNDQRSAPQSEN